MGDQAHLTGRDTVQIRSFRVVFTLERRLFKIDRFRLPFAYGIPLRAIAYAAAALAAIVCATQLPLVGAIVGALPPPIVYVAAPVGLAAVLTRVRVDGLPAHRAVGLWLAHLVTPRTLVGLTPTRTPARQRIAEAIHLEHDGAGPALRAGTIDGAREIAIAVPARAEVCGDTLRLTQTAGGPLSSPRRVRIADGGRVVIR